jgi:Fe-S-cluster containining protein
MDETLKPFFQRYLEMAEEVAAEFERNRRLHGERIHCRRGCTDCCHQIFQITEIEAAYISRQVKRLPPETRRLLRERARAYLPERQALLERHGIIEAWGSLPRKGTRLACPALLDGACAIYDHRPLICRKYGIPLYNPKRPGEVNACELNFAEGEAIEDDQLVPIQTGLYQRWRAVQRDYNAAGGRRDEKPISVARAIVEDFEDLLP